MTPLIDLAFALLIIFMITAPLLEQSIRLDLPEESERTQPPPPAAAYTVTLDAEGQLSWDGLTVSAQELEVFLAEAAQAIDEPVIRVRADRSLPYQAVIEVVDAIKAAGLNQLSLDTVAKR